MWAIQKSDISANEFKSMLETMLGRIHKALRGDKRISGARIKQALVAAKSNDALPLLFLDDPSLLRLLKQVSDDYAFVWSYDAEVEDLVAYFSSPR